MIMKGKNMEKTFRIQTHVTIDEEDLATFLSILMDVPENCGCAWYKPTKPEDYDKAEAELEKELGPERKGDICYTDVYARMLMNGGTLQCLDPESDWHWSGHEEGELLWKAQIIIEGCEPVGGDWKTVGLADIASALVKYGSEHVANDVGGDIKSINENGDCTDADAVIQYAMYGDFIYG